MYNQLNYYYIKLEVIFVCKSGSLVMPIGLQRTISCSEGGGEGCCTESDQIADFKLICDAFIKHMQDSNNDWSWTGFFFFKSSDVLLATQAGSTQFSILSPLLLSPFVLPQLTAKREFLVAGVQKEWRAETISTGRWRGQVTHAAIASSYLFLLLLHSFGSTFM